LAGNVASRRRAAHPFRRRTPHRRSRIDDLGPEDFAHVLARWDFRETNELIRQHNAWYPIERDLPMDPRTGEYVLIAGRPYQREELDAEWAIRELGPYAPGP